MLLAAERMLAHGQPKGHPTMAHIPDKRTDVWVRDMKVGRLRMPNRTGRILAYALRKDWPTLSSTDGEDRVV